MADRKGSVDALKSRLEEPISRRRALQVFGLGGAAAVIAACGDSTPSSSAAQPSSGASAAPTPQSSEPGQPATGGDLIFSWSDSIQGDFDPRSGTDGASQQIKNMVFLRLIRADYKANTFTPEILSEMPTRENDTTYLLKLRNDIVFHDGSALTAEDVKYTIDSSQDAKVAPLASLILPFIDSTEVVDPLTVRLHLKQPFGGIYDRLATIAPVPKALLEKIGQDEYKKAPVGTGPYKFDSMAVNDFVKVVRWADYKAGPQPILDSLTQKRIPDPNAQIAALQNGEIDIVMDVDPNIFQVVAGLSGIKTGSIPASAYDCLLMNNAKAPFDDERVRRAVLHTIDRDSLIQLAWAGQATPNHHSLPEWHPYTNPNGVVLEHDIEKAKQLMKDAGLEGGISIRHVGQNHGPQLALLTAIQAQLEQIGIKSDLALYDGDAYAQDILDGNFQLCTMYGDTAILCNDPDIWNRWLLTGAFNPVKAGAIDDYKKMLDDAAAIAPDATDQRLRAYHAIQDYNMVGTGTVEKDGPASRECHIDNRSMRNAWRDNIQGFEPASNGLPNWLVVSKA